MIRVPTHVRLCASFVDPCRFACANKLARTRVCCLRSIVNDRGEKPSYPLARFEPESAEPKGMRITRYDLSVDIAWRTAAFYFECGMVR